MKVIVKRHAVYEETFVFDANEWENIKDKSDETLKETAMMLTIEGEGIMSNSVFLGSFADATPTMYRDTVEVQRDAT